MKFRFLLLSTLLLAACIPSNDYQTLHDGDIGITIDYPTNYTLDMFKDAITFSDGTATAEFAVILFGDGVPEGHGVRIYRIADARIPDYLQSSMPFVSEKKVNGQLYREFRFLGLADHYGYVTEKNGQYYVLESSWGPDNPVAERMFKTLVLE